MKSIISPTGVYGGFNSVITRADSYEADRTLYPFNVIGLPNSIGTWVEPSPVIHVPESVTPRQIRMALSRTTYHATTLRAAVEAAIASGSQDLKDWYDKSTEFLRHQQNVIVMGLALGVSSADLDTLWILAATL